MYLKDNIRLVREKLNKTRAEFGELIGVTEDVVYTFESRGTKPKPIVLKRIAKMANVSTDVLQNNYLTEDDISLKNDKTDNLKLPEPLEPEDLPDGRNAILKRALSSYLNKREAMEVRYLADFTANLEVSGYDMDPEKYKVWAERAKAFALLLGK